MDQDSTVNLSPDRKRARSPTPSTKPRKRSCSPAPPNNRTNEKWVKRLSEGSQGIFGKNARGYEEVNFVGLFWEEEYPAGFRNEVEELACFFETEFQFTKSLFAIPTERSSAILNAEITRLAAKSSGPDKLLIVYYGGHGLETKEGKATWVSGLSHIGSTVDWHKTQSLLFESMGDVLIIIDSCYSAEAARGSAIDKKIELLVSAPMGCKSPGPGPSSYTTKLIETMKALLKEKGQFSITTLNSHLGRARVGLQQTPHYSDLTANDNKSIVLRPLNSDVRSLDPNPRKPFAYLNIIFGLSEEPSESLVSALINWFRQADPKVMTDCKVLGFLGCDDMRKHLDSFQQTVSINTIQEGEKKRSESQLVKMVLEKWQWQKTKPRLKADTGSPTTLRVAESQGQSQFVNIKISTEIFQDELSLLMTDKIDFDSVDHAYGGNISVHGIGAAGSNWNRQPRTRFSYGNLPDGRRVIVENIYIDYLLQDIEEFEKRIRKEGKILRASQEDTEPCIPRCVGYTKDPEQKRFGLVYSIPNEASSHTTLFDEIIGEKHIPIEHRLKLARTMARIACHFKPACWYHGSINSKSILFFNNNFSRPYLFGGCQGLLSVPGDGVWTWPSAGLMHEDVCDIKTLGALLHAVGLWKLEEVLAASREYTTATQSQLTEISVKKLEHSMGTNYRKATAMCLEGPSNEGISASDLFGQVRQLLDRALR